MKIHSGPFYRKKLAVSLLAALSVAVPAGTSAKTALDFLQAESRPHFQSGHSLPPLSRWGWSMPFNVRIELAEHWGYALEFGGYATPALVAKLDDPKSMESRLCALTAKDPKRYPLCVLLHRPCNDRKFRDSLPKETWCWNKEGELAGGKRVWSPEAPGSVFQRAGQLSAAPLRRILAHAPIALVLNGGEYGLNVYGFGKKAWSSDPKVMESKGDRGWFDYISEIKARQELPIIQAAHQVNPRGLYIYYHTFAVHRKRFSGWWTWSYKYEQLRRISDLPSSSVYYKHFNTGWTGSNDMLTQALNSVAQQMVFGDALSYNWMNAGWTRKNMGEAAFGEIKRYLGYLKCYYTAGMVSGCAGYFAYPKGGFGANLGNGQPLWLQQMTALARVHALFSHLEEFLRKGDLLPGPNHHRWSKELPAYEFPTSDPDARVLARKHKERQEWLITAWAAGGEDRLVKATVPELGELELNARKTGSVYRVTVKNGKPTLQLQDPDGLHPSSAF